MSSKARKMHSIEDLKYIVAPVAKKYGVEKVYLFGSVARGDCDESSDYDFCIEKGKIRSIFTFSGFFRDMRKAVGHKIDILTTKSVPSDVLNQIMAESVIIYG